MTPKRMRFNGQNTNYLNKIRLFLQKSNGVRIMPNHFTLKLKMKKKTIPWLKFMKTQAKN